MAPEGESRRGGGALAVGAGILASRIAGLVRTSVLGAYFGVGPHADVFSAALRMPNLLQNLLGEQTLSAAFIPIYSRLLAQGRREEAGRFAGAILALLLAVASGLALLGMLAARPIVALLASGFLRDRALVALGAASVDRYELAVAAVRWIFPMTAVLVLSAWALGVRNSHGRFFVAYFAPVLWNAAIVGAVCWVALGERSGGGAVAATDRLLFAACVGALVGSVLQLAIQLPGVMRDLEGFSLAWRPRWEPVREALAAFVPTLAGRGAVQLASYLDQILASFLVAGAVSALAYAQVLYLLPVSLFGMSIVAAALPGLSRLHAAASEEDLAAGTARALRQSGFLNLPSALAYLLLGLPAVEGVYQLFGRRFGVAESWLVYLVLATYAIGLPAATAARVLQSGFYARGDARTPARVALLRVGCGLIVGLPLMLWFDRLALTGFAAAPTAGGTALRLGAVGLAAAASLAAWLELGALDRAARRRWAAHRWPARELGMDALTAALAALLALALAIATAGLGWHPTLRATAVFGLFALLYLGAGLLRGAEPARQLLHRFARRRGA